MQQRNIKSLGITTSRLGFGLMRLPTNSSNPKNINYPKATEFIDQCWRGGVRYYDTAWVYHMGESENFAKNGLVERYPRSEYQLATKLPVWDCETTSDCEAFLNKQLAKLGTDYIDFYLLHSLNLESWRKCQALNLNAEQHRLKAAGKIRFAGFSWHGYNEDLPLVLDSGKWDFVQLQINYADWTATNAEFIYEQAFSRNIPIVVMEPLRGGGLAGLKGKSAEAVASTGQSQGALAMRFVRSLPGIDVILSGMQSADIISDNLQAFDSELPLTAAEQQAIDIVTNEYMSKPTVPCTRCGYCLEGCPQSIDIPRLFGIYNEYIRFNNTYQLGEVYLKDIAEHKRGSACVSCGACVAKCPQRIDIPAKLAAMHSAAESL